MSMTLLFVTRGSIQLQRFSQLRSSLLRPVQFSTTLCTREFSTLKSKYASIKPSSTAKSNILSGQLDDRSSRLKLQELIRFREKYKLESDYELIYSLPRLRLFGLMHFISIFTCVSMIVWIIIYHHRDVLELELPTNTHRDVPEWCLYAIASLICCMFGTVVILFSFLPTHLFYSRNRQTYALLYNAPLRLYNYAKILFRNNQYRFISTETEGTSRKEPMFVIQVDVARRILPSKKSFYFLETCFRSRNDIYRIQSHDAPSSEPNQDESKQDINQSDEIWRTVLEKKYQQKPASPSQQTPMR